MTWELERFVRDHEAPTFGRLYGPSFSCFTLERPWLDNKPFISCIPPGTYQLERRLFFRGGYETLEICDVPGRSHILLHIGNIVRHVQGCIALGRQLGCLNGAWAVLDSKAAFSSFWAAVEAAQGDIGQINIREAA